MEPITVSEFVEAINLTLDTLADVVVQGEVDEFKIIHNKWVTFQLKDADSSIGCFMTVWQYKTQVEDGMLVKAQGKPQVRNKGFFSFVLTSVQPAGEGALKRSFELLKQKLTDEGLFAVERKRSLPRFPQHIVLITSKDAAAYSDFLKILQGRQGGLTISFLHTQVQGADAPQQLKAALEYANTHIDTVDAIVMVRGGGSLEDLQAFNDESVVRAVAASRTPTIVGIGHERDVTLAELAADVRASTPSNAAELLVRSQQELQLAIGQMKSSLSASLQQEITHRQRAIARSVTLLRSRTVATQQRVTRQIESLIGLRHRITHAVTSHQENVARMQTTLRQHVREAVTQQQRSVMQVSRILKSLSPENTLKRGYSITRSEDGSIVRLTSQVTPNAIVYTQLADGTVESTVTAIAPNP